MLGQAEVENFRVVAVGDENIRGLDVAVNDALGVRGVERVGNFDAEVEQRFDFERTSADQVLQRFSVEAFHGEIGVAAVFADVVNGTDVGMIQRGRGFGFAAKTFEGLRVARQILGEKFQRDETVEAGVLRFVNDAHASAAQFFDDAVMGDDAVDERLGIVHVGGMLSGGARRCQREALRSYRDRRSSVAAVILSGAKNLIQYCVAPTVTSKAVSSWWSWRGSMDEILRRERRSSE